MYVRTVETKGKRAPKCQHQARRQNKVTYMHEQVREGLEECQIKYAHPSGKHSEKRTV